MPFSLAELTYDPDLAQAVAITRTPVQFVAGGLAKKPFQVQAFGILTVASSKQLQMIPEGDRLSGSISLISETRIYTTHADMSDPQYPGGISDKVFWNGRTYSVESVSPWVDFGFWQAILLRIDGA
jgi:hypothetical protein